MNQYYKNDTFRLKRCLFCKENGKTHKNVKFSRALHSDDTIDFLEDFVQECALPVTTSRPIPPAPIS